MCTSTVRSSTSADRPPDKVEQLRPREHPARLLEQIFEQPKIGRPEADFAIPTADAPGKPVQIEVSDVQPFGDPFRPTASEQRVHAGHQFNHRERLDDVVIRSDCETAHPLRFFAPRGDNDDRQCPGRLARPQAPANLDARNARQHPVENEEVRRIFSQAQLGLLAARDAFHDVALRLQIVTDQQSHIDLVLDDENARRGANARTGDGLARLVHSAVASGGSRYWIVPGSSVCPSRLARAQQINGLYPPWRQAGVAARNSRPWKTEWLGDGAGSHRGKAGATRRNVEETQLTLFTIWFGAGAKSTDVHLKFGPIDEDNPFY
jgi:hypothetical protein